MHARSVNRADEGEGSVPPAGTAQVYAGSARIDVDAVIPEPEPPTEETNKDFAED